VNIISGKCFSRRTLKPTDDVKHLNELAYCKMFASRPLGIWMASFG